MIKMSGMTYLGLFVNAIIVIITAVSERYEALLIPTIIAYLLCVLGVVLMLLNKIKVGSIMFYVGSVLFIPLGILGIMGVKKTISDIEEEKFNKENYGKSV